MRGRWSRCARVTRCKLRNKPTHTTGSQPASLAADEDAATSTQADHTHGLLSLLLAPHAAVDCLLLDQLALGDALHSAPQALPTLVPAQAPPVQHAGRSAAAHVALFQARGPPTA